MHTCMYALISAQWKEIRKMNVLDSAEKAIKLLVVPNEGVIFFLFAPSEVEESISTTTLIDTT